MSLRLEESTDWSAIYAIYSGAFGQLAEADLVRHLHEDGDLVLSLTAYAEGPAGHIAFSRMAFSETPLVKGCALAPLAVAPSYQQKGIGTALVRQGLKHLQEAGFDLAIVLGDTDYYGRFGFTPQLARNLKTSYDGPYLQALALSDKGKEAHGPASYARAFAELK